ncbi:uncharacterized protein LOC125241638 [Leguminivora glycinivorella]|uniref:uncharacterized protein LOC125241638 n=1 Tax=Leguminivora glycinivorella TaxID=1035111 RepID=UPI00200ED66E|nr:uncharacterized protein LOC125241638 [Leguminivora glycinivorella]
MYMQEQDTFTVKQEEEFSRPVESIMRCEDFKSNFARRLSNRYISRSPSSISRQGSALKLRPADTKNTEATPDNVPERIELSTQLSKNGDKEQTLEDNKSGDRAAPASHSAMQLTEVTALHMEVDTLRWQLAQTEANRQMHIALLNQIVTFLNRVKNHIECHKADFNESNENIKDISKERILQKSFNAADIPRSRSVVHVNKHLEYSLRPAKKLGTKKISKSISNVNGYKDYNSTWNQSKLSLTSETGQSQKITEEISRLITLANTVLSTKLPDLACNDVQNNSNDKIHASNAKNESMNSNNSSTISTENVSTNSLIIKSVCENSDLYDDLPSSLVDAEDDDIKEFIMPLSTLNGNMENEVASLKLSSEKQNHTFEEKSKIKNGKSFLSNKKLDYNHAVSKFTEDESGFSSMSSFQEIGIPIISIIPPSPCKEIGYVDHVPEVIEETGKWKNEIELNKQTVKVFWV